MAGAQYIVRNCTPRRLILRGRDDAALVLAPLERITVDEATHGLYDFAALARKRVVTCEQPMTSDTVVETLVRVVGGGAGAALVVTKVMLDTLTGRSKETDEADGPLADWTWLAEWSWAIAISAALLVILFGILIAWYRFSAGAAQRSLVQLFSLLLMLGIAVGLPAVVVFQFGGVDVWSLGRIETAGRLFQGRRRVALPAAAPVRHPHGKRSRIRVLLGGEAREGLPRRLVQRDRTGRRCAAAAAPDRHRRVVR